MDMTEDQYPALKVELNTNPKLMAFAGKTDEQLAALLNTVGASNEKQTGAGIVPAQAIMDCVVVSEWNLLLATAQNRLNVWLAPGTVNTSAPNVRTALGGIFGAQTVTQSNLVAAFDKSISRAESLFGAGITVFSWDVARAKALP